MLEKKFVLRTFFLATAPKHGALTHTAITFLLSKSCNVDAVTIIDVTVKNAPVQLSSTSYEQNIGQVYTHQGWLTEDHNYFMYVRNELAHLS
jgi:hypothetical protein